MPGGLFGGEKETCVLASGFRVLFMDQLKSCWHLQELEHFHHLAALIFFMYLI